MTIIFEYFEAISDYPGIKDVSNFLPVNKGDVVRLIKKDDKYFTVEKEGHIGKVSKEILR
jgi:hypothetical protein